MSSMPTQSASFCLTSVLSRTATVFMSQLPSYVLISNMYSQTSPSPIPTHSEHSVQQFFTTISPSRPPAEDGCAPQQPRNIHVGHCNHEQHKHPAVPFCSSAERCSLPEPQLLAMGSSWARVPKVWPGEPGSSHDIFRGFMRSKRFL